MKQETTQKGTVNQANQVNIPKETAKENSQIIEVSASSVVPGLTSSKKNKIEDDDIDSLGLPVVNAVSRPNPLLFQQSIPDDDKKQNNIISVRKFLGYDFLFMIPIFGLVMLFVKARDQKDIAISNFAKAQLIYTFIMILLNFILILLFFHVTGLDYIDLFG